MHILGYVVTGLLAIGAIFGAVRYEQARADYDPEAICAKQKEFSREKCLSHIHLAQSAGY